MRSHYHHLLRKQFILSPWFVEFELSLNAANMHISILSACTLCTLALPLRLRTAPIEAKHIHVRYSQPDNERPQLNKNRDIARSSGCKVVASRMGIPGHCEALFLYRIYTYCKCACFDVCQVRAQIRICSL